MYEIFEQLLLKFGATAYQVAKATGISTATLTNWKKGRYTPKQDKLQKIADYFGVTVEYLMTGKNVAKRKSPRAYRKGRKRHCKRFRSNHGRNSERY